MSLPVRPRRAGIPAEEARHRPVYARALGLKHVNPSGLLCFLFFEGTIALAVLLALAELVSWWGLLVLPASVAVMVKINDVVAGAGGRATTPAPSVVRAEARRGGRAGGRSGRMVGQASVRTLTVPGKTLRPAAPGATIRPAEQIDHRVGRHRRDHGGAPDSPGRLARQSGTHRHE
jgi:hypothetical protein